MPDSFTQEQLDFFTEQTRRAVTKATKRQARHNLVGFLALLFGLIVALYVAHADRVRAQNAIVRSGTVVAVDGCNARYRDRQALRDLFVRLQAAVKEQAKEQHLDPKGQQTQFALRFYRDELGRLPLPDCRPTAHILTAVPFPPAKQPTPLHPRRP